jgi:hypothetical protein
MSSAEAGRVADISRRPAAATIGRKRAQGIIEGIIKRPIKSAAT